MKLASWFCLQQFPVASNIHQDEQSSRRPMAGSPVARQHPFRLGISPIQRVMDSPCLSAAGLRFLQPPVPAEGLTLPCGRVAGREARPHRGFPVPHPLYRVRCLLYTGVCGVREGAARYPFSLRLSITVSTIVSVSFLTREVCAFEFAFGEAEDLVVRAVETCVKVE